MKWWFSFCLIFALSASSARCMENNRNLSLEDAVKQLQSAYNNHNNNSLQGLNGLKQDALKCIQNSFDPAELIKINKLVQKNQFLQQELNESLGEKVVIEYDDNNNNSEKKQLVFNKNVLKQLNVISVLLEDMGNIGLTTIPVEKNQFAYIELLSPYLQIAKKNFDNAIKQLDNNDLYGLVVAADALEFASLNKKLKKNLGEHFFNTTNIKQAKKLLEHIEKSGISKDIINSTLSLIEKKFVMPDWVLEESLKNNAYTQIKINDSHSFFLGGPTALSPNAKYLIYGGGNDELKVYQIDKQKGLSSKIFNYSSAFIFNAVFSSENNFFVVSDSLRAGTIKNSTVSLSKNFQGSDSKEVALSQSGKYLVSVGWGKSKVYTLDNNGSITKSETLDSEHAYKVSFTPSGNFCVIVGKLYELLLYSVGESGTFTLLDKKNHNCSIDGLAISNAGEVVVFSEFDKWYIYQISNKKLNFFKDLSLSSKADDFINDLVFSADGSLLIVSSSSDRCVYVFKKDAQLNFKKIKTLYFDTDMVINGSTPYTVTFSKDNSTLAVSTSRSMVHLLSFENDKLAKLDLKERLLLHHSKTEKEFEDAFGKQVFSKKSEWNWLSIGTISLVAAVGSFIIAKKYLNK